MSRIIENLPGYVMDQGDLNTEITAVTHDSRTVSEGALFVALKGEHFDGHSFIPQIMEAGAAALVYEDGSVGLEANFPAIRVTDSRQALPQLAANFYEHPERALKLIGITGTNGKTSSNYFLEHLLNRAGFKAGRVGTTGAAFMDYAHDLIHTTPESSDLYQLLKEFVKRGADSATLEVSSHALSQNRVDGLDFDAAIFSNLTQDHLDYHKSFDDYLAAKRQLFLGLRKDAIALINSDDPYAEKMVVECPARVITYGFSKTADYQVKQYTFNDQGTQVELSTPGGEYTIQTNTIGRFNIYNFISAFSTVLELGGDVQAMIRAAMSLPIVPGRLEKMNYPAPFNVFVDYAHTPDAMSTVLETLKDAYPDRKLITVFGCGGDRDQGKRPMMGEIATRLSTFAIITDDNPRTEAPMDIINAIVEGCQGRMNYLAVQDRTLAIHTALERAEPGDIIAILGKGHEPYQEIMGVRKPLSDMNVINEFMVKNGYSA
ncbi:MAG: UDP-N-acetylmuramoyl-L-alanyl-D-glutamate--2,6-diaminopimelate ligase [Candidatus Marinimicrobia bacterium]|nr:UDP-N-acetylmuramoyl-L-alanyl-D-glutamate--2,6-diaminopimelate ligase [Candidatus Neomarinimicrobiota bacterium]